MRIKKWLETPITWGSYLKMVGAVFTLGMALLGVEWAVLVGDSHGWEFDLSH